MGDVGALAFIQVSGTSSSEEGRTHQLNSPLNNKMNNQNCLRNLHTLLQMQQTQLELCKIFFVIGIPNLASSRLPPPPPFFPAPALVPRNVSSRGLTLQLTTACEDSYGVSSAPKRLRRWSCAESVTSGSRRVRFMSTSVVSGKLDVG